MKRFLIFVVVLAKNNLQIFAKTQLLVIMVKLENVNILNQMNVIVKETHQNLVMIVMITV